MKFNPTTMLRFYTHTTTYTPGSGSSTIWGVVGDALFGEWRGGFGERAIAAEAQGVSDMATIRTFYHPDIYSALKTKRVLIVKNADATAVIAGVPNANNVNLYELWGGVDNVENRDQFMEFKVRRYEPK